jgi:uncharacterized membrane protein
MESLCFPGLRRLLSCKRRWLVPVSTAMISMLLVQAAGRSGAARSEQSPSAAHAVRLQKTFMLNAPLEEVFGLITDLEQIPHYTNVERVIDLGHGRLRWLFPAGPGWDAYAEDVDVCIVPNRQIAWQSVPESFVAYAGTARFQAEPGGRTTVQIRMSYDPPGGTLGHALACLIGLDPNSQLDDNVRRIQTLIDHPALHPGERLAWGLYAE